jgi:UDP-2,3-diacylglucosamine pyrophosphatase LpxH
MSITELVYHGLKRKKSNQEEAKRLQLSIFDYKQIKRAVLKAILDLKPGQQIDETFFNKVGSTIFKSPKIDEPRVTEVHENVEAGTSKITGISSTEPRSPEEIIKILNIDTKVWKLSQFWNKEQNNKWLVSALITRLPKEQVVQQSFLQELVTYKLPSFPKIDPIHLNSDSTEKVCGVISLQDLHFGKPGNENMGDIMDTALTYLVGKAYRNYHLDKIIFIVGPDTLNMDTFDGTTTKGTPVENSEVATKAYLKAFDAVCKGINKLKQFCENLEVVFVPGNHDRLSSYHMIHAAAQVFRNDFNITFNVEYSERKVLTYGKCMIAVEHGDKTSKNNPLVYAVEFPTEWGNTTHRILYTGHYHGRKTKEVITENEEQGFVTRIIPALTSSDYYHYHNKWTGNQRSAIMHIHDANKGLISEFTYSV